MLLPPSRTLLTAPRAPSSLPHPSHPKSLLGSLPYVSPGATYHLSLHCTHHPVALSASVPDCPWAPGWCPGCSLSLHGICITFSLLLGMFCLQSSLKPCHPEDLCLCVPTNLTWVLGSRHPDFLHRACLVVTCPCVLLPFLYTKCYYCSERSVLILSSVLLSEQVLEMLLPNSLMLRF